MVAHFCILFIISKISYNEYQSISKMGNKLENQENWTAISDPCHGRNRTRSG